jgi:tetratricopeptide (TPR) repeat protein
MRSGEAVFVGRTELLLEARELIEGTEQTTVLCVCGPTEIGKSRAVERIAEEAKARKLLTAFVDLEESRAPQEVSKAIREEFKTRWHRRAMARTAMLEEQLTAEAQREGLREAIAEAGVATVKTGIGAAGGPAGAASGGLAMVKPVLRLVKRPLRRIVRPRQARWIRRRLAGLPDGDARFERRSRRNGLQALIVPALAADLAELVRRHRGGRAVLAMDHHQRSGQLLEPGQNEDFALALARQLQALDSRVTLVLGRDTSLEEQAFRVGHSAAGGDDARPIQLVQRPLGPLSSDELRAVLADLEVEEQLARRLADLCLGHPGIAIRAARENLSPSGDNVSFFPDDEASVLRQLASILDQLLERRGEGGRRLLRLAALPRVFDNRLLEALANGPVDPGWMDGEVRRGMLERIGGEDDRQTWRVERVWRGLILRGLADDSGRAFVEEGNRRALDYLEALPASEDPDAHFSRTVEILYHELSLDSQRNFPQLIAAADAELESYRTDRCQELLVAAEDLHSLDHGVRTQATLLRAKLYGDLNQYAAAHEVLKDAEREHRLTRGFDWASVAVALELAKVDRLSGNYDRALSRLREISDSAVEAGNIAVKAHCAWEQSLVLKQLDEVDESAAELASARSEIEALLCDNGAATEREARRFGISGLRDKPAHMDRHEAELRRLRGDYEGAHRSIEHALELYGSEHGRAVAHGEVVRAHILRMEGLAEEAATAATRIVELCREGIRDERLRPFALRAEVLARIALGEEPSKQIEDLTATDPSLYPAGRPSGHLALAELHRRRGELAPALDCYRQAREAAKRSRGQSEACSVAIGVLECLRVDPACGDLRPERLLDELLTHPCLQAMPWLALRAELQRAVWRESERDAALTRASEIVAAFIRRPEDRRIDERVLGDVVAALDNGTQPDPMPLEYL